MLSFQKNHRPRWSIARLLVTILATLIFLFGLYFIIFGAQLAWLGGSWYYVACGVLLTPAGILMFFRHPLGGWLYLLAWFLTIPWSIYEVGFDLWGWVPRLLGPTLIALAVAISLRHLYSAQKDKRHA